MSRLIILVLLLSGCTQTATTVEPISVACEVQCEPGGECHGKFVGTGEVAIDKSILGIEKKKKEAPE